MGGRPPGEAAMKYGAQMKRLMERTSDRVDPSGWCAPRRAAPPPPGPASRGPRGDILGSRPKARPPAAWDGGGGTTNGSAP